MRLLAAGALAALLAAWVPAARAEEDPFDAVLLERLAQSVVAAVPEKPKWRRLAFTDLYFDDSQVQAALAGALGRERGLEFLLGRPLDAYLVSAGLDQRKLEEDPLKYADRIKGFDGVLSGGIVSRPKTQLWARQIEIRLKLVTFKGETVFDRNFQASVAAPGREKVIYAVIGFVLGVALLVGVYLAVRGRVKRAIAEAPMKNVPNADVLKKLQQIDEALNAAGEAAAAGGHQIILIFLREVTRQFELLSGDVNISVDQYGAESVCRGMKPEFAEAVGRLWGLSKQVREGMAETKFDRVNRDLNEFKALVQTALEAFH